MSRRIWTAVALAAAVILGVWLWNAPARSAEVIEGPIKAEVVEVIDGDTLKVRAHVWLGQRVDISVRVNGIDTPEMKGKCRLPSGLTEGDMAMVAKARLEKLAGKAVYLRNVQYGKYAGRVVADVKTVANDDIGLAMIGEGLARKYDGKTKRAPWC